MAHLVFRDRRCVSFGVQSWQTLGSHLSGVNKNNHIQESPVLISFGNSGFWIRFLDRISRRAPGIVNVMFLDAAHRCQACSSAMNEDALAASAGSELELQTQLGKAR